MQASDVASWLTLGGMVVAVVLLLRLRVRRMAAKAEARAEAVGGGAVVNLGGIYLNLDGSLAAAIARGYEDEAPAAGRRDGRRLCSAACGHLLAAGDPVCLGCGAVQLRALAAETAPVAVRLRDGGTWER